MSLKFNCSHCSSEIITSFVKVGEEAKCLKCKKKTVVPENAKTTDESSSLKTSLKNQPTQEIIEEEVKNKKVDEKIIDSTEKNKNTGLHGSLSQDYQILIEFKTILYLLMIVNTGYTVYSSIQILDASKALKQYGGGNVMNNTMLSIIIAYVISMFSLFCLTKIIDFLFDLDKKSNK